MVDGAGVEETAARAATSTDRVMSLRVSLFSMTFSFVSMFKPLRLRGFENALTIRREGGAVNGAG